jgi:small subunit ribosomal protein S18
MAAHGKSRSRTKPDRTKAPTRRRRPKVCVFCAEHIPWVDYKDTNLLKRLMSDRGKIKSRANTGTCAQHQRDVAIAIKTAREMALLPYVVRTVATDKGSTRRGRGPGRPDGRPSAAQATPDASNGSADGAPTPPDLATAEPTADTAEV